VRNKEGGEIMEKRNAAISVRFTDAEKETVTHALSQYGDIAVSARMILMSFSTGHMDCGRMVWPPECYRAIDIPRHELDEILLELSTRDKRQRVSMAAEQTEEPYTTNRERKK